MHGKREKQGNVVYGQRVLQTAVSLGVVSLVFRGHDRLKIANINPQQEATLSLWKKIISLRERPIYTAVSKLYHRGCNLFIK